MENTARREAPRLWIPRAKIIEPKRELISRTRLQGYFMLEAVNARTGRRRRLTPWFPNLITNQGLNYIGNSSTWFSACAVGTGNTAPAFTDTQLGSQVAVTGTTQSNSASAQSEAPYYATRTKTFRFSQGAAAGNLAEIAIGPSGTPMLVFARALILDDMGSPTTITVQADEFLDATYSLEYHPDPIDSAYQIDISGVTTDVTRRPCDVTSAGRWGTSGTRAGLSGLGFGFYAAYTYNSNAALGAITSSGPTGGGTGGNKNGGLTDTAYSLDDFFREFTLTYGLNENNESGGIGAMKTVHGSPSGSSQDFGAYQYLFDPPIAKDSTKILSLTFRHSWARFVES